MAAAIFERLVDDLSKESFMIDFKYVKSKSWFKSENRDIVRTIRLRRWPNGLGQMYVDICYGVKFEAITMWFDQFNVQRSSTIKDGCNILIGGEQLNKSSEFKLEMDGSDYPEVYQDIRNTIAYCSANLFSRYDTLEHYFEYNILPIISGNMDFNKAGGFWIFGNLAACKLVAPQLYPKLKKMIMDKIDEMYLYVNGRKIRDGYAALYDGRWDEIFDYLENTDIANLPKRRKKK